MNDWSEINKARKKDNRARRLWLTGFVEGCLVVLVTALAFGWWMFWRLP